MRYAGESILVTAQLIDPKTNSHLWSRTYPGDLSDLNGLFAMQADIAANIANALEAELSQAEQQSIESIPTDSPEAYALYLQALAVGPNRANPFLDQAIELDDDFALAYALRARSYTQDLLGISGANSTQAGESEQIVRESAQRALDLDPTLATAHAALAAIYYANWRGNEAEAAFQRAYQLRADPDLALANSEQDALRMFAALEALAREQPVGHAVWARAYLAIGDNERAFEHLTTAVAQRTSTDLPTLSELATNPSGNPVLSEPAFRRLFDGLWDPE